MKPKPLESLNHFTVPVAIADFLSADAATIPGATKPGMTIEEGSDFHYESCCELRVRMQIRCLMNHCGADHSIIFATFV
jgi:hypothetical protein